MADMSLTLGEILSFLPDSTDCLPLRKAVHGIIRCILMTNAPLKKHEKASVSSGFHHRTNWRMNDLISCLYPAVVS